MREQTLNVTIRHFDGCPHWELARDRVQQALGEMATTISFELIDTTEMAEAVGFRGSPTILIDGVDPFGDPDLPIGLSCRIYLTENGIEGAPSVAQLVRAFASTGG